mmetsp:Transcript_15962/g.26956  ORF Transcript_15962/g.26956 Transcript_15962/m.26956 type:complete len:378 (+) Transcript_15962:640-1773(+)
MSCSSSSEAAASPALLRRGCVSAGLGNGDGSSAGDVERGCVSKGLGNGEFTLAGDGDGSEGFPGVSPDNGDSITCFTNSALSLAPFSKLIRTSFPSSKLARHTLFSSSKLARFSPPPSSKLPLCPSAKPTRSLLLSRFSRLGRFTSFALTLFSRLGVFPRLGVFSRLGLLPRLGVSSRLGVFPFFKDWLEVRTSCKSPLVLALALMLILALVLTLASPLVLTSGSPLVLMWVLSSAVPTFAQTSSACALNLSDVFFSTASIAFSKMSSFFRFQPRMVACKSSVISMTSVALRRAFLLAKLSSLWSRSSLPPNGFWKARPSPSRASACCVFSANFAAAAAASPFLTLMSGIMALGPSFLMTSSESSAGCIDGVCCNRA